MFEYHPFGGRGWNDPLPDLETGPRSVNPSRWYPASTSGPRDAARRLPGAAVWNVALVGSGSPGCWCVISLHRGHGVSALRGRRVSSDRVQLPFGWRRCSRCWSRPASEVGDHVGLAGLACGELGSVFGVFAFPLSATNRPEPSQPQSPPRCDSPNHSRSPRQPNQGRFTP